MKKIFLLCSLIIFALSGCDNFDRQDAYNKNNGYYIVGSGWDATQYNAYAFHCEKESLDKEKIFYVKCVGIYKDNVGVIIETYTNHFEYKPATK